MKVTFLPMIMALLFTAPTASGISTSCVTVTLDGRCNDAGLHDEWQGIRSQNLSAVRFVSIDDAISLYRYLAQQEDWPQITGRFLLQEGTSHAQVFRIRERLRVLGDYPYEHPLVNKQYFDSRLKEAVAGFQQRHGLKVDGIVGVKTRGELNISPRLRWHQLLVNKQRLLADPTVENQDYIEVNIPEYSLRYYRGDRVLAEMRVIVGKKDRPTPIINSTMKAVEFNPDWNVPRRIAFEDILPTLQADPEQFSRLDIKLVKGWQQEPNVVPANQLEMDRFYQGALKQQYRFWQPPGQRNPLGQMKFIFPNNYSIYMHGTPGKHLFEENQRGFSSGCIRVENPRVLAELLFQPGKHNDGLDIDHQLETESASITGLTTEVAVFTRYRTAWLDKATGLLQFRTDIYKRDRNELPVPMVTEREEAEELFAN